MGTHRLRQDRLPREIIRHLEQQGLGWGHDLYPGDFWLRSEPTRKTKER